MIQITNKSDCCGCTACYSICSKHCISMQEDNEGFCYPQVDTSLCINCDLCTEVCPLLNYEEKDLKSEIYAAKNRDADILNSSASGGAFFALAKYVLSQGGFVYGAAYSNDFLVLHIGATTIKECKRLQGSKYVQSNLIDVFGEIKKHLLADEKVLFSGTPCQVAGLNKFLCKEYDNLLTCDIICHSVPSPKIFKDYLTFLQRKKKLKSINMRWKGRGWNKSRVKLEYEDGTTVIGKKDAKLWMQITFSSIVSRPSCHVCKFTNYNRQGDFTIGDFWDIKNIHPGFFDNRGISLIFVNTSKATIVFRTIQSDFELKLSNKEESSQLRLSFPTPPSPKREQFWIEYDDSKFVYFAKKYWKYGLINEIRELLLNVAREIYYIIRR